MTTIDSSVNNHPQTRVVTNWIVVVPDILAEDQDDAVEKYGQGTYKFFKDQEKGHKMYYKCSMHYRFGCKFRLRRVRDWKTGLFTLEKQQGVEHHHSGAEHISRGLLTAHKDILLDAMRYNLRIKPSELHKVLIDELSKRGAQSSDVEVIKKSQISRFLQRNRSVATKQYFECTIAGLWDFVCNNQRSPDQDSHHFYVMNAAGDALPGRGRDDIVRVFLTTDALLRNYARVENTTATMQLVTDSKHKVLLNNYPVIALGVTDACHQFNLLALCVSNKEDTATFESFFRCTKTSLENLDIECDPDCTMSDNCLAIHNAFRSVFPDASVGNCFFHALKNNRDIKGKWNLTAPEGLTTRERNKWLTVQRESHLTYINEIFRWLQRIPNEDLFRNGTDMVTATLLADYHHDMADNLSTQYFAPSRDGWSTASLGRFVPLDNNGLESFNNHTLKAINRGSRMTLVSFLDGMHSFFRYQSLKFGSSTCPPPMGSLDLRSNIRLTNHARGRIRRAFSGAVELQTIFDANPGKFFAEDESGGYFISPRSARENGISADTCLETYNSSYDKCRETWHTAKETAAECISEYRKYGFITNPDLGTSMKEMFAEAWDEFEAWRKHVHVLKPIDLNTNGYFNCAKEWAQSIVTAADSAEEDKNSAMLYLDGSLLELGLVTHHCTCLQFMRYFACKHSIWATLHTTGKRIPVAADDRPIAGRRRAGRPRRTAPAFVHMTPDQNPLI